MTEKKVRKSRTKKTTNNVVMTVESKEPTISTETLLQETVYTFDSEVERLKFEQGSEITLIENNKKSGYSRDDIDLIIDQYDSECIDVDYSLGHAVNLPPPTSDSVAEYNHFYEKHFPNNITKNTGKETKSIEYAGKKYELDPPLILTVKQKRHYVKVYNKYLKKRKFKKFIQDGMAFYISKEFTGSPETATYIMLPKKTKFEKVKLWIGYQIFSKRELLSKFHLLPKGVLSLTPLEEVKAIQYALEGRLFENQLNFTRNEFSKNQSYTQI